MGAAPRRQPSPASAIDYGNSRRCTGLQPGTRKGSALFGPARVFPLFPEAHSLAGSCGWRTAGSISRGSSRTYSAVHWRSSRSAPSKPSRYVRSTTERSRFAQISRTLRGGGAQKGYIPFSLSLALFLSLVSTSPPRVGTHPFHFPETTHSFLSFLLARFRLRTWRDSIR